mmetsp:Transcript_17985/g.48371  ORF Transcript_17985/g.48371 Transcript_17985/m.48371 type:complete len:482 (+) Transcript_17985:641-2086(+)
MHEEREVEDSSAKRGGGGAKREHQRRFGRGRGRKQDVGDDGDARAHSHTHTRCIVLEAEEAHIAQEGHAEAQYHSQGHENDETKEAGLEVDGHRRRAEGEPREQHVFHGRPVHLEASALDEPRPPECRVPIGRGGCQGDGQEGHVAPRVGGEGEDSVGEERSYSQPEDGLEDAVVVQPQHRRNEHVLHKPPPEISEGEKAWPEHVPEGRAATHRQAQHREDQRHVHHAEETPDAAGKPVRLLQHPDNRGEGLELRDCQCIGQSDDGRGLVEKVGARRPYRRSLRRGCNGARFRRTGLLRYHRAATCGAAFSRNCPSVDVAEAKCVCERAGRGRQHVLKAGAVQAPGGNVTGPRLVAEQEAVAAAGQGLAQLRRVERQGPAQHEVQHRERGPAQYDRAPDAARLQLASVAEALLSCSVKEVPGHRVRGDGGRAASLVASAQCEKLLGRRHAREHAVRAICAMHDNLHQKERGGGAEGVDHTT